MYANCCKKKYMNSRNMIDICGKLNLTINKIYFTIIDTHCTTKTHTTIFETHHVMEPKNFHDLIRYEFSML